MSERGGRILFAVACVLTALGIGLIIACSFLADETRRYLAGGGLALVALGGTGLLIARRGQARNSVRSWTGPTAVAFVLGGPILVGLAVFVWLHL